jgi:hypothetical protein
MGGKRTLVRLVLSMRSVASHVILAAFLLLCGCATVPLSAPDVLLTEDQTVDLMEHPQRWIGRTVTLRIYPYDNGYEGSYVACLEACGAALADRSIFVIYTRANRFRGYNGHRSEIVKAVFARICPAYMPLCLDSPIRVFALNEVG